VKLPPGIYALTGANGSGKSTLFRVLMSCETNQVKTDLPSSIHMMPTFDDDVCTAEHKNDATCSSGNLLDTTSMITMPSRNVAEISQTFYWPLYTRPIDWIYQQHFTYQEQAEGNAKTIAKLLDALEFAQTQETTTSTNNETQKEEEGVENGVDLIAKELLQEKEDWFADLSGGQKSKVELVRKVHMNVVFVCIALVFSLTHSFFSKVFLHDNCPTVLLIDETLAPLDPMSKSLVMSKLKSFCGESVVIVIYHTDVMASTTNTTTSSSTTTKCVPSNGFFQQNLHLENRTLFIRDVC